MNCKRFLIWIFIGIVAFYPQNLFAQGMAFSAQVSAEKVGTDDIFQLAFILKNAPGNTNYRMPSLQDFIVRQGPSQSQSSQINIINGRTEQSSTIELTYILQARKTGNFKIDPLEIIIGDQHYFTNAVNIEVVKGSLAQTQRRQQRSNSPFGDDDAFMQQMLQQMQRLQQSFFGGNMPGVMQDPRGNQDMSDFDRENLSKNIFIKVEVDKTRPFVGEQITAKYKLYTRLNMNMQLTQLPSLNGFWSEDFQISDPSKPTIEMVNGKEFKVFLLKKSALFPQQSGKLVLDPAKVEGMVEILENYYSKSVKMNLVSQPVTIDVQPLPKQNQPSGFTGGVGNFSISATVDSNVISTDNGGTLRLVISGSGNLKLIGAPQVRFPEALGVSEPQVADTILRRTPDIAGKKTFNYFLSPQKAGNFEIPPIEFSYFNAQTKQYMTLRTLPIKIKVKQGSNIVIVKTGLPDDIHGLEEGDLLKDKPMINLMSQPWYWSIYLLAFIGFCVLLGLNKKEKKAQSNIAIFKNKKANKVAWKRLATARNLMNTQAHIPFYEEVSKAIWLYLSDKLVLPLSVLSKENISEKLSEKNISHLKIEQVNKVLSECEMALYSPSGGLQQKAHILDETADLIGILENDLKKDKK